MVSDGNTNQPEIQGSGIREEVTTIKEKWNFLETNISSQKLEKENIESRNLQLRNEIRQLEETRLL